MKFRINLLATWFAGWIISILLRLLCVFSLGVLALPVAFLFAILTPACFCYYAGLRSRNSLISVAVLASLGLYFGTMFTPSVSMSRSEQAKLIVESPLHEMITPSFFFSGVFMFCGLILDPNTKKTMDKAAGNNADVG